MSDIYELLAADHREAEKLFEDCERCRGPELQQTFAQLANALLVHAKAEERAFYARLVQMGPAIEEARDEHHEMERLIDACRGAVGDDEALLAKLHELKQVVQHHVQEEEHELFPRAREVLGDQEEHARANFVKLKDVMKASVTAPPTPHDVVPLV